MTKLFSPPYRGVLLCFVVFFFIELVGIVNGFLSGFSARLLNGLFGWLLFIFVFYVISIMILKGPIIDTRLGVYIFLTCFGLLTSIYSIKSWGYVGNTTIFLLIFWVSIGYYFFAISDFSNKHYPPNKLMNLIHNNLPHSDTHPFAKYTNWIQFHLPKPPLRDKQSAINLHYENVENIIKSFKPSKKWRMERQYQDELYAWLKNEYPNTIEYEKQTGSSRPDLVIDDIAIEIKGPTGNSELNTLTTKFLKYSNHYPHFIIVLFDCNFSEGHFNEIYTGIKKFAPHVKIIRIN